MTSWAKSLMDTVNINPLPGTLGWGHKISEFSIDIFQLQERIYYLVSWHFTCKFDSNLIGSELTLKIEKCNVKKKTD